MVPLDPFLGCPEVALVRTATGVCWIGYCYAVRAMMGGNAHGTLMSVEQKKKLLWGKKAEEVVAAPVRASSLYPD